MSRKKKDFSRTKVADPRFGDALVAKAINLFMLSGKKGCSEKAVYGALDLMEQRMNEKGLEIFTRAIQTVKPTVEVRSRRVGGATYQVPTEVRPERAESLALRWVRDAARARTERTFADCLAGELMDALSNRGNAMKKREDTHRMAEANKAFAHFRW